MSIPLPAPSSAVHGSSAAKPYKIACLCDLRDAQGRILLLRRIKAPNQGLASPIGGKLDVVEGESPAQCAQREILEEAGIDVPLNRLHLIGLVSECEFEGGGHWLMFVYRVLGSVWVEPRDMREGRLDWFSPEEIDALPLPETDRLVIWPLLKRAEAADSLTTHGPDQPRHGFFAVHIDCRNGLKWSVEQEVPPWPASSHRDALRP